MGCSYQTTQHASTLGRTTNSNYMVNNGINNPMKLLVLFRVNCQLMDILQFI